MMLLERIEKALSDELMAFLALLTVLVSAAPLAFEMTPELARVSMGVEVLVVSVFALEYGVGFALA